MFRRWLIDMCKKLITAFSALMPGLNCLRFRHGKMYEYEPGKFDSKSVTAFVEHWYTNVQAKPVPVEQSAL